MHSVSIIQITVSKVSSPTSANVIDTFILKTPVLTKRDLLFKELTIFKGNAHHSQNGGVLKVVDPDIRF